MTVSTEINTAGPYIGDGQTKQFAIGFPYLDSSCLKTLLTNDKGETELVLNHDYGVIKTPQGNDFIQLTHALPVGQQLMVARNTPQTQDAQYVQGDAFSASSHEQAVDKLTMLFQELETDATRTIKTPDEEDEDIQFPAADDRKNKVSGFNEKKALQPLTIGNGLTLENDLIQLKDGVGMLSNKLSISVLYGNGIDAHDKAIVIKQGNGLAFDEQSRLEIEKTLFNTIQNSSAGLIDLQGLVNHLEKRILDLELEGGGEVTIFIGDGLHYDLDGNLTIKPHAGINVTAEGVSVRIGSGLEIDPSGNIKISDDVFAGILTPFHLTNIPTTKINNFIYVLDREEIYSWVDTPYYKGYRSPKIGSIEDEGVNALRPWQVDAVGLTFKKDSQEMTRLWSWAKECGIVVSETEWQPKTFMFADVDDEHFRVPDLRDLFKRYTGTNADDGLERETGTYQADQLREHDHDYMEPTNSKFSGNTYIGKISSGNSKTSMTGGSETRPENIAVNPRIHI